MFPTWLRYHDARPESVGIVETPLVQRTHLAQGGRSRTWRRASIEHYPQLVERWRRVLGHDRYFLAELRVATPAEGGRNRAIQGGYHAQWWVVDEAAERWVGSGPIDFADEQRSIKPGGVGRVKNRPMDPASWHGARRVSPSSA